MHHKKDKKTDEPTITSRDEDDNTIDATEGSQKAKEQSTTKGSHSSFFKRWKKDKKKEDEDTNDEASQKSHKKSRKKDKEEAEKEREEDEDEEFTVVTTGGEGKEEEREGRGEESEVSRATGITVIPAPEEEDDKKSERKRKKKKDSSTGVSGGESCEDESETKKSSRKDRKKKKKVVVTEENEEKTTKESPVESTLSADETARENNDSESVAEESKDEDGEEQQQQQQQQQQHSKKKKSHKKSSKPKETEEGEQQNSLTSPKMTTTDDPQNESQEKKTPSSTKEKSHKKKKKDRSASAVEEEAKSDFSIDGSDIEYSIVEVSEKVPVNSKKKDKGQSAGSTSSSSTKALSVSSDTAKPKRRFLKLGSQSYADIPPTSSEEPPSDTIALSSTPSSITDTLGAQESASSSTGASTTTDSTSEQQIIFKPAPSFTPVVAQSTSSSLLSYGLFGRKVPLKPQKSMSGWTQCRALQKVYGCLDGEKQSPIRVLKWSRSGEFLASGNKKGEICIWKRTQPNEGSIIGREPFAALAGHTADVLALDWFENGNLISGSRDNTAIIWTLSDKISMNEPGDFVTYKNEFASLKHNNSVTSVATCPNNKDLVLTGCMDNSIRMWNLNTENSKTAPVPTMLFNVKEPVNCVSFSPDSNFVLVGTTEGNVLFCSAKDFVLEKKLNIASISGKKSKDAITGFKFRSCEPTFLVSSTDGCIRLYDSKTLKLRKLLKGFTNTNTLRMHADFSDDGTYVVCGSEDKSVYVWNTNRPGENPSESDKEILSGESFRSSLEKMTSALFVPRLPSEKSDVMEGRFIVGSDRFGYITIYENPKLFSIDDETTEDSDEDSDGSSSDTDDSSSDDDDASESVCE